MMYLKLKAGALYYVIGIAVVIALLLVSFITLNGLQLLFMTRSSNFKETVYTNQQSFRYLQQVSMSYNRPLVIYSPTNPALQTTLKKKHWGIFDLLFATSQLKSEKFRSVSLLGSGLVNRSALYLSDHKKPLVLAGNTRIEGDVLVPKKGVKRGAVGGNNYYHQQLLFGQLANSKPNLPKLTNRAYLQQIATAILSEEIQNESWKMQKEQTHSFWQPTKLVYTAGRLDLQHVLLQGNIIVQSDTHIRVFNSSQLKDILLLAPIIEIMDGVKGNFQAIASRELQVGKHCELRYPSALVLCEGHNVNGVSQKKLPNMRIDEGSRIQGVLAYVSDDSKQSYKSALKIHKNVLLEGELYCEKNLDCEATIYGTVYADAFVAEQFGSVYQNHLYNCRINSNLLPVPYGGLFIENQPIHLAKWLY